MAISRILISLGCLVLLILLLSTRWHSPLQEPHFDDSRNRVVATVGPRSITLGQVEQAVALLLYQADLQRATLLQKALQELIDEELLAAEAARKGITVAQLLADASQSETIARLANLPAPVKRLRGGKTGPNFEPSLDPQESARLRQTLLVSLRRQVAVHVDLSTPEPPILPVSADDDPWTGAQQAPVTIVEFSDFQCPYCKLSVPVLKEVLTKYPGKVKLVYRDYAGPSHPHAQKAAEAAQCAFEQGLFWAYHDLLFDQRPEGAGWNFGELAQRAGANVDAFSACLTSGRYTAEVKKDLDDALKLGVVSTPTFFINGRPLVGAHPFSSFQSLIEEALASQIPG